MLNGWMGVKVDGWLRLVSIEAWGSMFGVVALTLA